MRTRWATQPLGARRGAARVVSSEQMAHIDRQAQEQYHLPAPVLMENAGARAYQALRDRCWGDRAPEAGVVFVAGRGNNGGDALVMARHAHLDGVAEIAVVLAGGEPRSGSLSAQHLAACRALGIAVIDGIDAPPAAARLAGAGWIVDGITGTGLGGALRAQPAAVVAAINAAPARVVAVDVPSGLWDGFAEGPAVRADFTLTIGLPKLCLYLPAARMLAGDIVLVSIGFPPALLSAAELRCDLLEDRLLTELLAPLPADAHKGRRGHLAVFAGAPGTTGAAHLCAGAAAATRAGLVTLYADEQTYTLVAAAMRSAMCRRAPATGASLEAALRRHAALLIGPGWGLEPERRTLLAELLAAGLPGVIDADGLTVLGQLATAEGDARDLQWRWVLTPHPGELARLVAASIAEVLADPLAAAREVAERWHAVVVLKGHVTVIAGEQRSAVLDRANPALGTGGSGDVLAGAVAGLLVGGSAPEDAARAAVLLHAQAGERAFAERGFFVAEALVPYLAQLSARMVGQ